MDKWKAFANSLKLKMYLRMVNRKPDVCRSRCKTLYAASAEFLTTDAGVTDFTDVPGLDNPLYEQNIRQLNTTNNIKASKTFVSWLTENNDPRIESYFGQTNPMSINQGDYTGIIPLIKLHLFLCRAQLTLFGLFLCLNHISYRQKQRLDILVALTLKYIQSRRISCVHTNWVWMAQI